MCKCVDAQEISEFDINIAERILTHRLENEHLAALICALSLACREGHLCFSPSLISTLFLDSANRVRLEELVAKGLQEIGNLENKNIIFDDGFLYFKRFHQLEIQICKDLQRLSKREIPSLVYPKEKLDIRLNTEQKDAIEKTLSQGFCLLSGGPGTGKTFTAAQIISTFLDVKPDAYIGLCAPTGKAAAHLEKVLKSQFASSSDHTIASGTIHSLFDLGRRSHWSRHLYSPMNTPAVFYDLLIIDECSMIDAELFAIVLKKISSQTRVVLIGDGNQLAPVEIGSLFADIKESLNKGFPLPVVELKNCMRSDNDSLLKFADDLLNQNRDGFEKGVDLFRDADLSDTFHSPDVFYDALWNATKSRKILSCLRKGPFGVDAINTAFLQRACSLMSHSPISIPILITKSQDNEGLSKGEMGTLFVHNPEYLKKTGQLDTHRDFMVFDDSQGSQRKISTAGVASWDYAYCLSVHQSQGSEFEDFLLVVPQGSEHFGKEVLYTAVTRARKSLTIVGAKETLQATMMRSSRRLSGIKNRLFVYSLV